MLPRFVGLAALLTHPRARHLLVACGLVVGLLLAAGTAMLLTTARRNALAEARTDLQNLALVLAAETDREFQATELVQLGLLQHLQEQGVDTAQGFVQGLGSAVVGVDLRSRIARVPQIDSLSLISRFGETINTSQPEPHVPMNVRGQDYFRVLTDDPERGSYISAPVENPANGKWSIVVARPFMALDGRLLGIVAATIQLDSFEQFFGRISVQGDGSFALFRLDGVLLARFPHLDAVIGHSYAATETFRTLAAAADHAAVRLPSTLDGVDRLIAPHNVAHYPLLIAATETVRSILAQWRVEARSLVGATIFIELVVAGIVLLGVRQMRTQEGLAAAKADAVQAQAELQLAHERERNAQALRRRAQQFDVALSNMQQGLAMFDNADRLVVANRRFYELVGLADNAPPGVTVHDIMQLAEAHGGFSADDMRALHNWRQTIVGTQVRASHIFDMTDGRTLVMTHQPIEDGWIATYEDITQRCEAEVRLAYVAGHDLVTDLPNRVLFRERLNEAMGFARRGKPVALLCLDLDQFKAVNDTLGHPIGDALLKRVAARLMQRVRETDTVARLGGDEFAVVQAPIDKPTDAADLAERLLAAFVDPFEIEGQQIVISTSIGVAYAPQDGQDVDQLLKNADLALYRAKSDGRGVYRMFHTAMDAEMQARRRMELDLRQALNAGQFEVYYQPLVALQCRAVAGFEALLRWHHPERGMIPPDKFIPLAEEIGVIVPIGGWVLRQACAAAATWTDGLRVSVNLSAVQCNSLDLVATVTAALHDTGLAPERLELEITETVMLQDTAATLATLHALRSIGVCIAMDDFGTGYSSLSYLQRFPFDRIKIDQSFVRELGRQHERVAIIRAVVALARDLGMATTAEGVETREQFCILAEAGCSEIQGYLFSRPVPLQGIPAALRNMPRVGDLLQEPSLVA